MASMLPPDILSALPIAESADSPNSPQLRFPLTFTCASCERIIGDSSTVLFQHASTHLVFTGLHSLDTARTLAYPPENAWDFGCPYYSLSCSRCQSVLGKQYFATHQGMSRFLERCVVDIDKIAVYQLGGWEPAAKVAESAEVLKILHPAPDDDVRVINGLMGMFVGLAEGQQKLERQVGGSGGIEELQRRVGELERRAEGSGGKEDLQSMVEELELEVWKKEERIGELEKQVELMKENTRRIDELERNTQLHIDSLRSELQALKTTPPHKPSLPKQKRDFTATVIDISAPPPPPPRRTVVPNSQSTEGGELSFHHDPESSPEPPKSKQLKTVVAKATRPAEDSGSDFHPEDEEELVGNAGRRGRKRKSGAFNVVVTGKPQQQQEKRVMRARAGTKSGEGRR